MAIIMGLGIVASISSIYKTTLAKNYGVTGDTLTDGVALTIWSDARGTARVGVLQFRFPPDGSSIS